MDRATKPWLSGSADDHPWGSLGGVFSWPPRSYPCSFCRREFRSAQALGGHMNVHRRDRARLRESLSLGDDDDFLQHATQAPVGPPSRSQKPISISSKSLAGSPAITPSSVTSTGGTLATSPLTCKFPSMAAAAAASSWSSYSEARELTNLQKTREKHKEGVERGEMSSRSLDKDEVSPLFVSSVSGSGNGSLSNIYLDNGIDLELRLGYNTDISKNIGSV